MARRPRAVFPGVAHHVTQHGNNRQPVFFYSDDQRAYLDLLGRNALRYGLHIVGYCLMPNHIHLIAVPDREDSLAWTLRAVHSAYALGVNQADGRSGHLWQGRYHSCPMDELHLIKSMRYVDLNPVRAGLASTPAEWRWSSARAHSRAAEEDSVLDPEWRSYFRSWNHASWQEMLRVGLPEGEAEVLRQSTRYGAALGSAEFVARLEHRAGRSLRVRPSGRPRKACPI